MATGLDLIREENPALALIPDDELIEQILQQYQGDLDPDTFVESLLNEMPVESPVVSPTGGKRAFAPSDEPSQIGFGQAFAGPAKSSWARSWGPSITRLRGGIAGLFGYEDTAQQLYEQAVEQDKNILQDSGYVSFAQATQGPDAGVSTFVKAGLSATGQSSPYLIEGITGALAGAKIGRFAGPWGVAIGAGVGAAVASFPRLFEFNISRQQEQVSLGNLDGVNEGLAAITALPQAAAESFMFPLMGKLLGPLTRSQMSNILSQATLGRVAKGSSIGIVTEAATEVGQQVLERYQAGLPIDTPEAIAEYTEAAYAGGFVGGLLGGVTTGAGEAVRATQPKPQQQKIEEPKVQEGIQQKPEATVLPEEQKAQSVNLAKEEEVKPATFNVEQQGDKFALNRIDETGNKTAVGGPFNTQQEATAKQQEVENQKSKVSQQTFFTKDEIIKENPAIGNIINELEEQGNTIAPHVKQVYFQKNLALPKGDFTNVQASGGTSNSVVDGWYDRTRDYVAIGTADLSKASETVGHENFHALQRHVDRSYKSGLFKQDEQAALDSYFPDNQSVDSIPQSVQKGLGKDVMARLRERHADRPLSRREMQAYAFGAYSSLKAQGKRMAAPNPVIRAFQRLWNLIKSAGNVFRKNKVNSVQDLFEKARTGEIGKRAVPKKGIEKLQTEGIAQAEEVAAKGLAPITGAKDLALTTPITDKTGKTFSTILPTISPIGEFVAKQAYQRGLGGERLRKVIEPYAKNAVSRSEVDGSEYAKALSDIQSNETELNQNKEFIKIQDADGNKTSIGDESGRFVNREYAENLQMLGNAYGTLLKVQAPIAIPSAFSLSAVKIIKKPPTIKATGAVVKKTGKKRILIDDVFNYLEKNVRSENKNKSLDITDKKVFKNLVKQGVTEFKYQKSQPIDGMGWYDSDVKEAMSLVKEFIPQSKKSPILKELIPFLTAIFSAGTPVGTDWKNAINVTKLFAETKRIPTKNPNEFYTAKDDVVKKGLAKIGDEKNFGRFPSHRMALEFTDYYIQKNGLNKFIKWLDTKTTVKEINQGVRKESGVYKGDMEGAMDKEVNGADMFGDKVGAFMKNLMGVGDENVIDIWNARGFNRKAGNVWARNADGKIRKDKKGKLISSGEPRNDQEAKIMNRYMSEVAKKVGESVRDTQAVLWYFEQGLYTSLGVKSEPKSYADVTKKEIDNVRERGVLKGKKSDARPVRGISDETELSVSEIKQEAQDYEGNLDEAPDYLNIELSLKSNRIKQLPLKQIEKPNDGLVSSIEKYKKTLEKVASEDTAFAPKTGNDYDDYVNTTIPNTKIKYGKLYNHCKACAVAVQEKFGGDIIYIKNMPFTQNNGVDITEGHYINLIDGHYFDVAGQQFGNTNVLSPVNNLKGGNTEETFQTDDIRKKRKKTDRIRQFVELANGETKTTAPTELSVSEGQNQYQFEDTELSVSNRPGSYKGSIKISNDIPNSLKNKIKKDVGDTDVMQEAYNPESKLKEIIYLLGNKLEENYKGFKSKFQTDYMIGVVTSNKYTDPNNKNVSQIKYFATDESDNLIGAAQGEIALYPKTFSEYTKINKIDRGEDVYDEAYELYEKRRENEDSKFFTRALELKQGGSYNVRATGLLTDELIKYAKSNDIQHIVLSDVLNEQAVRAFTRKGFIKAKRNSPFYGKETITSGIRGKQKIRTINLVAEVDSLTPELSVSENLEDVIPTELSVSKPKLEGDFSFDFVDKDNFNASDPQFEDFTSLKDFYDKVIGDVDTLEGEFETQGIGSQLKTDDYGDGTGRFYVNIIMDGDNVGYIHGENTDQDIAYVHYARVFGDSLPNQVWKNLAKEFKRKFGTKRFAGYRITGARRLSEKKQREVEEKLLGGATYVSPIAISPEFSVSDEKITIEKNGKKIRIPRYGYHDVSGSLLQKHLKKYTDKTEETFNKALEDAVAEIDKEGIKNISPFYKEISRPPIGFVTWLENERGKSGGSGRFRVDLSKLDPNKLNWGTGVDPESDVDSFGYGYTYAGTIPREAIDFMVDVEPELSILENQVKKIDSSIKRNPSTGVGKKIGGDLYVHQSAENAIPDLESYKEMLPDDFTYDVVKHSPKIDAVSFIKSPNWDTVDEPLATTGLKVFSTGRIRDLNINQIYHHKWLFVRPDYAGFDVEESIRRSLAWLPLRAENKIKGLKWASIGRQEAWDKVIPYIPESGMELSVSEEDIEVANRTSRTGMDKALVPRWVEENVSKKSKILDFGAGTKAEHTARLKRKGFNVTAHDFGKNVNPDIHDVNALDKTYDVVYASNVLNVQNSEGALNSTLEEISNAINEDGYAVVNFPALPRKGFLGDLTPSQGNSLIEEKLREYIGDIQRITKINNKTPSSPTYKVEKVSQDKKIKYGLEFSVSKDKFSEGTERVLGNINPTRQRRTIPGYWKSLTDNWRIRAHQGIADQYSSVKKYIGEEPYKLLTMTHSSSGAIEGALNYGVPFLDKDGAIDLKDNTLGTGLFTRLEKLGDTLPNFLAWVAANRAKHLTTEGKETGLGDIKDINTAIKELPKGNEKLFNEVMKDVNEFRDAFLQIARDSGYLSQEAYNAWTDNAGYNFYIPFYRLLEDETSNSGPKSAESIIDQPEVKKYVGSTLPLKDLFSNMLQNFNFLAEVSLKNQAGLKTLEQGESMGVTTKVNNPTKTSVFARKNGRMVHYEVNEPLVLKSLEALNWSGWSNPAMGILRNFKRYLTIGVTASPAFRIRNLIRDTIHSIAVSKISYNPLNNVLQGGKGFSLKGRKLSEARAKMAFGGGEIHFGHIYGGDPNATQMLLDRNIDLNTVMQYDGWTKGSKRFFASKVGKGLDWWQEVGNTAENINRAALYQQLKAKGESHFEASYQARDLLNFSRHGANPAIRFLTQSIPFLNARIQGLDKAGRAFNQGQRAQLLTTLAVYSLASVGLYLAFKDDDDFKDREEWDRDTYHWFKIPGTETAFRIPRPFEVGAVGVMFERMVEQMVDDDVHGSLFAERMLHTITETFAIDYKPQLITPALEVYANKDTFTKRPIQSAWMEKLPPSERKYAYTSSAYVNASKALELIPWKAIQYSPVQIEHLVQGYFGWVGSSVAQVVSFSDYPRKLTQFTSAESPLFMGFVKPLPSIRTKYKTEFYEAMREMNEVNALMNMYMKSGETDKAMKIYNKNKNLIAWRSTYVKTNTQITKINRQIKLIESQKNLSEREKYLKVKQLNLLKAQIMRTLKENVLAYEKANDTRVKRPLWWK